MDEVFALTEIYIYIYIYISMKNSGNYIQDYVLQDYVLQDYVLYQGTLLLILSNTCKLSLPSGTLNHTSKI